MMHNSPEALIQEALQWKSEISFIKQPYFDQPFILFH